MVDPYFDRDYQAGRAVFNASIESAAKAIARFLTTTGRAIHKFEFDAPWNQPVASRKRTRRVRAAH